VGGRHTRAVGTSAQPAGRHGLCSPRAEARPP
jgi:hypothetical protein